MVYISIIDCFPEKDACNPAYYQPDLFVLIVQLHIKTSIVHLCSNCNAITLTPR